ncbi:MAG: hypothetical protein WAU88_03905 [Candidatus Zixiibacteriota bacterium]
MIRNANRLIENRYFCGGQNNRAAASALGELALRLDSFHLPIIGELIRSYGITDMTRNAVRRMCCDNLNGLLGLCASLRREEDNVTKSYCDLMVIFDPKADSMIIVDSVDMHADEPDSRGFGYADAAFDKEGRHLYFEKFTKDVRHAYAYDIASRRLTEMLGYSLPLVASNSDGILAFSEASGTLDLLGKDLLAIRKVRTELPFGYFSCWKIDSLRFLVGSRERVHSYSSAHMKVSLVDFSEGKVKELFDAEPGFILGVELDTLK